MGKRQAHQQSGASGRSCEWLTRDQARKAPIPMLWWVHHHSLLTPQHARAKYELSRAVTSLCWPSYLEEVDRHLPVDTHDRQGRPIIGFDTLLGALYTAQIDTITSAMTLSPEPDPVPLTHHNDDGITDLVRWHLAHDYALRTLGTAHLTDRADLPARTPSPRITPPPFLAVAYANTSVLASHGEELLGSAQFDWRWTLELANRAAHANWPLPPYPLGLTNTPTNNIDQPKVPTAYSEKRGRPPY